MGDDLIERLNRELAGDTHRINRRKSLRLNRIQSIAFDRCEVVVKAHVTLKRKIRRKAEGPIVLKAATSVDVRNKRICLDKARISSVNFSHTTQLGEGVYRWVANKVLPSKRCFRFP